MRYQLNPSFPPVLCRGAGDLATGVAYRLALAGFPVVMTELAQPIAVRTTVAFGSAVPYGAVIVEGVIARLVPPDHPVHSFADLRPMFAEGAIPILVDPDGDSIRTLHPTVVVDCRVAKAKLDTTIHDAPLVIALGPGFEAGVDCHAVVETNRGHNLGRVYWQGSAEPDTGTPASVNGKEAERVLRAPKAGKMTQIKVVGMTVRAGEALCRIDDVLVYAPFDGVIRGLLDDDVYVTKGFKIGDLDPRARRQNCFTISDKSLAVGGGVLEAILHAPQTRAVMALNQGR